MIDAGDQEVRRLEEIGQDPFWPARPTFPKTHYTLYHPSIPMECRPFGITQSQSVSQTIESDNLVMLGEKKARC